MASSNACPRQSDNSRKWEFREALSTSEFASLVGFARWGRLSDRDCPELLNFRGASPFGGGLEARPSSPTIIARDTREHRHA